MEKFKTLNNFAGRHFLDALVRRDERRICYLLFNYRDVFIQSKYDFLCRLAFRDFPFLDKYVSFEDSVSCDVSLYITQLWRSLRATK